MLDLPDVARREEFRQAEGLRQVAPESLALAGGVLGRGEPGSFVNHAAGLGFAGEFTQADVDRLVDWYAPRGIEPRVELVPFAHESVARELAARGFVLRGFESVFYRELAAGERVVAVHPAPAGLRIDVVDPADAAGTREFALTAMSGFLPPGTEATEADLAIVIKSLSLPDFVGLVARLDGQAVAAGAMSIRQGVAALFGVSVRPEFRRRGIQQAIIAARMERAGRAGATLATISSRPGVATERNVRRMGFQVAYTKVVLVRPGEGLVPVAT
jgi:GNAT superfamily N-acetyltransferase